MTLMVSPALDAQAEAGDIGVDEFLACVRDSLPYAWSVIEELAARLKYTDKSFVDNQEPSPNADALGQILRIMASDSMRAALEEHYDVKLAFQNCHRIALFKKDRLDETYQEFISYRSQILNQKPWMHQC